MNTVKFLDVAVVEDNIEDEESEQTMVEKFYRFIHVQYKTVWKDNVN